MREPMPAVAAVANPLSLSSMSGYGQHAAGAVDPLTQVMTLDTVTFQPNEEVFWEALDKVSLTVSSFRIGEDKQGDTHVKENLRTHLGRDNRMFDILCFKEHNMPLFEAHSPRLRKAGLGGVGAPDAEDENENGNGTTTAAPSVPDRERVITRISDKQQQCIVSLKPTLMYPHEKTKDWVELELWQDSQGSCCNYPRMRKTLGNYKNTGFCQRHVFGGENGSEIYWTQKSSKAVRGFNLVRNQGESKLRHMLCLDTHKGKIFLKWCTQCHLWKNFSEFCDDITVHNAENPQIDTFCHVCKKRQMVSRSKQLEKRRSLRKSQLSQQTQALPKPLNEGEVNQLPMQAEAAAAAPAAVSAEVVEAVAQDIVQHGAPASIIDAPQTPEIQEAQEKENGELMKVPGVGDSAFAARQQRTDAIRKKKDVDLLKGKKAKQKRKFSNPEEKKKLNKRQIRMLKQIIVKDFPFHHPNEHDFLQSLDTVKIDYVDNVSKSKPTLRQYFESSDRLGDILFFPFGKWPVFAEENNPIPKRGNLSKVMASDVQKGVKYYPSLRVGDTQELCIVNLMPMLLSPVSVGGDAHQPGFQSGTDWRYQQIKTGPCVCIRSTSEAKKKLENYKFTGFCYGCVKGEGMASQENWIATGGASIRGFNAGRKKVDHRPRHLLCLENNSNQKIFLKWCTQCHTWKNYSTFLKRDEQNGNAITKLNTFCAVCHRRQMVSRKLQNLNRNGGAAAAENNNGSAYTMPDSPSPPVVQEGSPPMAAGPIAAVETD